MSSKAKIATLSHYFILDFQEAQFVIQCKSDSYSKQWLEDLQLTDLSEKCSTAAKA